MGSHRYLSAVKGLYHLSEYRVGHGEELVAKAAYVDIE
jgi:hypothetical protein